MLPIYDSHNVEVFRNKDVVWLEVRMAQKWPVESCFLRHQKRGYLQILVQAFDVFFW